MLATLWARLSGYVIGLGAILVVIGTVFLKGRASGQRAAADRIAKQNAKLQRKFDEIDRTPPDLDASIERLSKRAQRRKH